MKNFFFYIVLTLFFGFNINAQKDSLRVKYDTSAIEQRKFDPHNLEKYKADKEFDYEVKKREPTFLERAWNWFKRVLLKILSWVFGNEKAVGILAVIVRILPYLIAGIVLFLLLKFFLKVNSKSLISGTTNKSIVNLTEEEQLIKSEDINELIKKAIEQQNYRLAVRYYYLLLLQKLSTNNIIDWEQQKTNEDYIKEIKVNSLKDKFISSTYLYDFVWYGSFDIDESAFLKAQQKFEELNKLIK